MSASLTLSSSCLTGKPGLSIEINANGSIRRMDCGDTVLNLFIGNESEGGPANIYLRRGVDAAGRATGSTALLGPRSPTRFRHNPARNALEGVGEWCGIRYTVTLSVAANAPGWFWHVSLQNIGDTPQQLDLIYAQDVALAPYGTIRMNEYYVSQYVDHTALDHATRGCVVASRQNLTAGGRSPWCVVGSLRRGKSFATDALQLHGLANRSGAIPVGLVNGLPARRLQHEHSMVSIQDEAVHLQPGARVSLGFFGWFAADHPAATSEADLICVDRALALPEAEPVPVDMPFAGACAAPTLFSASPLLAALDLEKPDVEALFGADRRHEEFDEQGQLLSFFNGANRHVVLRAKELRVQRPHGHLLRTGRHSTPDETALTSTTWMAGVFHSMLTQGHVSINRFLSTLHGYIGLFRSHGQRVFVELDGAWQLLDVPSAFEMAPEHCRWIYRHARGVIEVRSGVQGLVQDQAPGSHEFNLQIDVRSGPPLRFLVCHHVALNGDDGNVRDLPRWWRENEIIIVAPAASSELGQRFARGGFHIAPAANTVFEQVGGDELLFVDGKSREQPYICVVTAPATSVGLRLRGDLVIESPDIPGQAVSAATGYVEASTLRITPPAGSPLANHVARIADIVPWFTHNALVHYLSPRGLEQYSGGGWGTRDVCQGPMELLLASGHMAPIRDLLLRVLGAQSPDGDWPQWFMFFERDRHIRAGDSHGDIVFWPVLALSQYLIASGDAQLLDQRVPFFHSGSAESAEQATVWQHIERALAVIEARVVAGTSLAAYGHGDWNDALQPADPAMREHMCSAWTVTLHYQTLVTLAHALRVVGRDAEASRFESGAQAVRSDFQRVLLIDGVLTGYALFDPDGSARYLLHPRDEMTGVRYSALAMIHAILEDLFSPQQARDHLQLIETHLSGPDGVRLFDRPMPYHGGPQRLFQRAESATFFGREIGLMYMHAHLRYAQALAHMGEADRFFHALCQANPIGIRAIVPPATLRQANCYYSSSDAAFDDRYQASAEYERVAAGTIALDGGWRVYSSGAGIALSLIVRRFLGLSCEFDAVTIDPVMPVALNGLQVQVAVFDHPVAVTYEVRGAGCGVNSVEINGKPMPLVYQANPHRRGAARISRGVFVERLTPRGNTLKITVG
jgi:cellobiose phosphorylase